MTPDIKLILSDIDGTILPFGATQVSERTRQAFVRAQEHGIAMGPASGRVFGQLPAMFNNDMKCLQTAIATNGCQVFYNGETIREVIVPRDRLYALRDATSQLSQCGMLVFDGITPLLVSGTREDLRVHFPTYADICIPVDDIPNIPIVKANVFMAAPEQGTRAIIDTLNKEVDGLDFDYPRVGFSNVMVSGNNKATGIDALVEAMGITLDNVVVFGDAGNDLTMFNHVANCVAVAGATPEAAAAARWHIGACEDDAVACAVEMLACGEWPFTH